MNMDAASATPAPSTTSRPWWRTAAWQVLEAADSGWSLIVYSTYFGIFVEKVLHHSAVAYGTATVIGALFIALLSPLLGALVDVSGPRKPYLRFFGIGTVLLTVLIGTTTSYPVALTYFVLAYIFVNATFNFWTSMLPAVAGEKNVSAVVAGAVGISYLSNIALLVIFGKVAEGGIGHVFLPIALVYLIYALPAMTVAPDFTEKSKRKLDVAQAYRRIVTTFQQARQHKPLFAFIVADFFYENAVASVIALMVVYVRHVMGFSEGDLVMLFGPALLVAGLSAFAFGKIVQKIGPKKTVMIDLVIWLVLIALTLLIQNKTLFMAVVAPLAGIGLAGVWSSSRVMLTALVPSEKAGEFWGLYNLSGRTASVVGDATWTGVLFLVGETVLGYKAAVASLAVWIVLGLVLMQFVPDRRPTAANVVH